MGKLKRKEKPKKKGRTPKSGDTYSITTEVGFLVDANGDDIADFVIHHEAFINGELMQRSHNEWICTDADIQAEFEAICEKHGIEDAKLEFTTFRQLVHYWKKFTKALNDMNELGEKTADLLGEAKIA